MSSIQIFTEFEYLVFGSSMYSMHRSPGILSLVIPSNKGPLNRGQGSLVIRYVIGSFSWSFHGLFTCGTQVL